MSMLAARLLLTIAIVGCVNSEPEIKLSCNLKLDHTQAQIIGEKIWQNEGSGQLDNLTIWGKGESFASLGIGHFIWYTADKEGPYQEQFPALLLYLVNKGIALPAWLSPPFDNPWSNRAQFYQEFDSSRLIELRKLLNQTMAEQMQFILQRVNQALPKMLKATPIYQRNKLQRNFCQVAQQPLGSYALIDYINFKGEGTSHTERYNGQGWGLMQVLLLMPEHTKDPLADFVNAANQVLTQLVANNPSSSRWLLGWQKRLQTYLAKD